MIRKPSKKMIALIDADAIVYIIGWNYKEMGTEV